MCDARASEPPPLALFPAADERRLWGYIDATGNFVIEPRYQRADRFAEDLAYVWDGESSSFIGPEGEVRFTLPSPKPGSWFSAEGVFSEVPKEWVPYTPAPGLPDLDTNPTLPTPPEPSK